MSGTVTFTPPGTLNRLRASVLWTSFPALNVTFGFLGKRGISMTFTGDATAFLPVMAGAVTSPEPYYMVDVTIHLLKSQTLSNAYKLQQETNTLLGSGTIRPDSRALTPFKLSNCAIRGVGDLSFAGDDTDYPVRITGTYYINTILAVG